MQDLGYKMPKTLQMNQLSLTYSNIVGHILGLSELSIFTTRM